MASSRYGPYRLWQNLIQSPVLGCFALLIYSATKGRAGLQIFDDLMGLAESRFARLIAVKTMNAHSDLRDIPPVSRLSSNIVRILGCNPGPMTLQGTNTYLLGTGAKRLLIDTGENGNSEYLHNLTGVLKEEKATISHVVLTHWHSDHTGGIQGVLDIDLLVDRPQVLKLRRMKEKEVPSGIKYNFVKSGDQISVDGAFIRVIHTPGHTDDHISLLLEDSNALFSGDCILGETTAVFEELSPYLNSLRTILSLKPSLIYPAHGSIVEDPGQVVQQYIDHRMQREEQIVGQLGKAFPLGLSVDELVAAIYPKLNFVIRKAAASNVKHQLDKLISDGKVEKYSSGYKLVDDKKSRTPEI